MKRREFITLLGGATFPWSFVAHGQASKPVIGFLRNTSPDESAYLLTATCALISFTISLRLQPHSGHPMSWW